MKKQLVVKLFLRNAFVSLILVGLAAVVGCVAEPEFSYDKPPILPSTPATWYAPGVSDTWQWQLSGTVNTSYEVNVYDIDLFDATTEIIEGLHSFGIHVICYFSAGSYENFRPDKDDFPESAIGNKLDGWPGEKWLDIRSDKVHAIMQKRLDLAVQKRCDGVEPDNMDAYANNSGFDLKAADQLAYNKLIANEAHRRNLAVGLKNDINQIPNLLDYFDFAVNEQCHEFNECGRYQLFTAANKPVFNVEYGSELQNDDAARDKLCQQARFENMRTLILPIELDDSFRYSCD